MANDRRYPFFPLTAVLVLGCAAVLAEPPAAAPADASAAAPAAATSTAPGADATKAAAEAQAAAMESIRKSARLLGLTPRVRAGKEMYCRSAAEIGTRVASVTCFTSVQVLALEKRQQSNQDDVDALRRASLSEPTKN